MSKKTELLEAIMSCNEREVENLLSSKILFWKAVSPNTKYNAGWTPLITASVNGYISIVEMLLKAGANIDLANEDGLTPLNIASQSKNNLTVVEALLKAGANMDIANKDGETPIYIASMRDNLPVFELLLKAGANVDIANKDGETPINKASQYGNLTIVEALLKAGANMDIANKYGETPILCAFDKGHDKVVETLLKAGAKLDESRMNLFSASEKGHTGIVSSLLKAGAKLDSVDNDGNTALMLAAVNGHFELVKQFIKSGANVDIKNNNNKTALMLISSVKISEEKPLLKDELVKIAEILIKAKAKVNEMSDIGETALLYASYRGHTDIVRMLIKSNADVNVATRSLFSMEAEVALEVSTIKQKMPAMYDSVKGLLDNLILDTNLTPIMLASSQRHPDIVKQLIDAKADVNKKSNIGWTALIIAAYMCDYKIINMLIDAKADVNAKTNNNIGNAITAAKRNNNSTATGIVSLLKKAGAKE